MSLRIQTDPQSLRGAGTVATAAPHHSLPFPAPQLSRKGVIHLHLIQARNVKRVNESVASAVVRDGYTLSMRVCSLATATSSSTHPLHTLDIPASGECLWNNECEFPLQNADHWIYLNVMTQQVEEQTTNAVSTATDHDDATPQPSRRISLTSSSARRSIYTQGGEIRIPIKEYDSGMYHDCWITLRRPSARAAVTTGATSSSNQPDLITGEIHLRFMYQLASIPSNASIPNTGHAPGANASVVAPSSHSTAQHTTFGLSNSLPHMPRKASALLIGSTPTLNPTSANANAIPPIGSSTSSSHHNASNTAAASPTSTPSSTSYSSSTLPPASLDQSYLSQLPHSLGTFMHMLVHSNGFWLHVLLKYLEQREFSSATAPSSSSSTSAASSTNTNASSASEGPSSNRSSLSGSNASSASSSSSTSSSSSSSNRPREVHLLLQSLLAILSHTRFSFILQLIECSVQHELSYLIHVHTNPQTGKLDAIFTSNLFRRNSIAAKLLSMYCINSPASSSTSLAPSSRVGVGHAYLTSLLTPFIHRIIADVTAVNPSTAATSAALDSASHGHGHGAHHHAHHHHHHSHNPYEIDPSKLTANSNSNSSHHTVAHSPSNTPSPRSSHAPLERPSSTTPEREKPSSAAQAAAAQLERNQQLLLARCQELLDAIVESGRDELEPESSSQLHIPRSMKYLARALKQCIWNHLTHSARASHVNSKAKSSATAPSRALSLPAVPTSASIDEHASSISTLSSSNPDSSSGDGDEDTSLAALIADAEDTAFYRRSRGSLDMTAFDSRASYVVYMPPIVRQVQHRLEEMQMVYESQYNTLASFFFLRFACPALVTPTHYGLLTTPTKSSPSSSSQSHSTPIVLSGTMTRALILIAKAIQSAVNSVGSITGAAAAKRDVENMKLGGPNASTQPYQQTHLPQQHHLPLPISPHQKSSSETTKDDVNVKLTTAADVAPSSSEVSLTNTPASSSRASTPTSMTRQNSTDRLVSNLLNNSSALNTSSSSSSSSNNNRLFKETYMEIFYPFINTNLNRIANFLDEFATISPAEAQIKPGIEEFAVTNSAPSPSAEDTAREFERSLWQLHSFYRAHMTGLCQTAEEMLRSGEINAPKPHAPGMIFSGPAAMHELTRGGRSEIGINANKTASSSASQSTSGSSSPVPHQVHPHPHPLSSNVNSIFHGSTAPPLDLSSSSASISSYLARFRTQVDMMISPTDAGLSVNTNNVSSVNSSPLLTGTSILVSPPSHSLQTPDLSGSPFGLGRTSSRRSSSADVTSTIAAQQAAQNGAANTTTTQQPSVLAAAAQSSLKFFQRFLPTSSNVTSKEKAHHGTGVTSSPALTSTEHPHHLHHPPHHTHHHAPLPSSILLHPSSSGSPSPSPSSPVATTAAEELDELRAQYQFFKQTHLEIQLRLSQQLEESDARYHALHEAYGEMERRAKEKEQEVERMKEVLKQNGIDWNSTESSASSSSETHPPPQIPPKRHYKQQQPHD